MIPGKQKAGKLLAAIKAQALIASEQGFVAQRRNIIFAEQVFVRALPCSCDDRIDTDDALQSADSINTAVNPVEGFSKGVANLVKRDQPDCVFISYPLKWHTGYICT